MSIWIVLTYAVGIITSMVALSGNRPPTTLSLLIVAGALAILAAGLLTRGIRSPVI